MEPVFLAGIMLLAALGQPPVPVADEGLAVGDLSADVHRVLGEPQGYIKSGGTEFLLYDRGRVELKDGVVTGVDLVSAETAEAMRLAREQQRAARAEASRRRRETLREAGETLRLQKLGDPAFQSAAAGEQLAFWQQFRRRYRDVNVDFEYAQALARHRQELEKDALERRLAELERRLDDTAERARRAELEAEEARRRSYSTVYYRHSPVVYARGPVVTCPTPVVRKSKPCYTSRQKVVGPRTYHLYDTARSPYMWQRDYFGGGLSYSRNSTDSRIRVHVGF